MAKKKIFKISWALGDVEVEHFKDLFKVVDKNENYNTCLHTLDEILIDKHTKIIKHAINSNFDTYEEKINAINRLKEKLAS